MTIHVSWKDEEPTASAVAGPIANSIGWALLPGDHDPQWGHQLIFECKDLQEGIHIARGIIGTLNSRGAHGEIFINEWDLGAYACQLERKCGALEMVIEVVILKLKETRSWFRDKRIAQIRRDLESDLLSIRSNGF